MIEETVGGMFCNVCSHEWHGAAVTPPRRFASLDDLVSRTGLRRDEVVTLADIGALNSFGYDRRSALWQAERAVRPAGALLAYEDPPALDDATPSFGAAGALAVPVSARPTDSGAASPEHRTPSPETCPLKPMTESERLVADYAGTGLTIGRHPMALRREELAMRGVLRAIELHSARQGRVVRVAGMVITRQRPGTAKGFVFLTLEDETGVANIIVRPDLFARDRMVIIEEPFLVVEGVLQNQDGVVAVRAEAVQGMRGVNIDFDAHDFY
jgi:error-prone DNA polymerase